MAKKPARSAPQRSASPRIAQALPEFDPARIANSFGVPRLDVETMATAQRRNVEALTAVCQLAFDCVQASAQRQAQVFRDTAEEMVQSFRKISVQESPQAQAASQMAVGRQALERGMTSLRELAELIAKTNTEAFDIINKRATNCIGELQNIVTKAPGRED
jgi:phasin family protein